MALTKLKIAVFAPMPSATAVKPGFLSNCRTAKRRSLSITPVVAIYLLAGWFGIQRADFQIAKPDFVSVVLQQNGCFELQAETGNIFVLAGRNRSHQLRTFQ